MAQIICFMILTHVILIDYSRGLLEHFLIKMEVTEKLVDILFRKRTKNRNSEQFFRFSEVLQRTNIAVSVSVIRPNCPPL